MDHIISCWFPLQRTRFPPRRIPEQLLSSPWSSEQTDRTDRLIPSPVYLEITSFQQYVLMGKIKNRTQNPFVINICLRGTVENNTKLISYTLLLFYLESLQYDKQSEKQSHLVHVPVFSIKLAQNSCILVSHSPVPTLRHP